jgi:xanthine/uracil permease
MSDNEGNSLGDLVAGVTNDLATLMRQEIQLARAETMEKISQTTRSLVWIAAGGMVAYAGVIGLLIAAIVGLAAFMPLWVSAVIVGLVVLVIGFLLIQSGRNQLKNMSVVPERTVASIQEDAAMVKEKVS